MEIEQPEVNDPSQPSLETIKSPIDGSLSMVTMLEGKQVCQYCFECFDETRARGVPTEIYTNEQSTVRVKVHLYCHENRNKKSLFRRIVGG